MFPIELFCVKSNPAISAQNLGVIFNKNFTFHSHISAVCSSCFYHMQELWRIHRHLDLDSAKLFATALMYSCLDYWNSTLYGIIDTDLRQLQHVQNRLACLVTKSLPSTCGVPLLHSLQWLPVRFRILFKINLLTYKTLREKQPVYLHSMLAASLPNHSLKSNNDNGVSVPRVKTNTGARALHSGTTSRCVSIQPIQLLPLRNIWRHISLIWPSPHRYRHSPWPVDVIELFPRFCCWILIRLSRHWAWLCRGYWRYRSLIDWYWVKVITAFVQSPLSSAISMIFELGLRIKILNFQSELRNKEPSNGLGQTWKQYFCGLWFNSISKMSGSVETTLDDYYKQRAAYKPEIYSQSTAMARTAALHCPHVRFLLHWRPCL